MPGMDTLLALVAAAAALAVLVAALFMRRSLERATAAEAALRESEERLRLIADNVPALISYVDSDERYAFSNRTYGEWFGVAHERMRGRAVAEVFGAKAYAAMQPHLARVLAGEAAEFELSHAEGGRHRTLQVACVPHVGPGGRVQGFYMLANDVTALKRAQEDLRFAAIQLEQDARRLEFLAHHDPLTGLPNRAMFEERARESIAAARRYGRVAAVLFIDLDHFKEVNDSLGHDVGDAMLQVMASRLRANVRGEDFVARIGGDEFCVLLQQIAEPREAAAVAQKLIHELGKPYRGAGHDLVAGASIGIACVPQDGDEVAELLRHSDAAMYRAKQRGRNGYQFFSAELNRATAGTEALAEELRAALELGQIFLAWQPRIDLAAGTVHGAEALLRWRHPRLGVLAPEEFLGVAEDAGLLAPLGRWVLLEACAQARRWLDAGVGPLTVAINMGVRELRRPNVADDVRTALRASGVPGDCLLIEVAEASLREVPEPLEQALGVIAATGARLGVDDFGTGYASLPLLQRLNADTVCVDRRLVAAVPGDAESMNLVRALVALAHGLGFEAVAKGIETAAQRDFLLAAGCRLGQGELLAAPGDAEAIEPLLRSRRVA